MHLDALAQALCEIDPAVTVVGTQPIRLSGVCDDSRAVLPGHLFAAIPGTKNDGTAYVTEAVARGATALLVAQALPSVTNLPQFISPHPRRTLSFLASVFYGEPWRAMQCLAVTGTKGKTTSAFLLRAIMQHCGVSCGLIGTVFNIVGDEVREAKLTTPGAVDIQHLLADMRAQGQSACAMEVSSHALDQERAAAISFSGAIFTNLTHEHLDYHATMESYFEAKTRLFAQLHPEHGIAVINVDTPWGERLVTRAPGRVIRVGTGAAAEVRLSDIVLSVDGMHFTLHWPDIAQRFDTTLTGRFNAMNLAEVIALSREIGLPLTGIRDAVAAFRGAPGRLERVPAPQGPTVFVDYAHAPDALEQVLSTVRELCTGRRLVCVFGCGGDRDRTKRPKMGAIAAQLAHRVIVTSDNPRTENPLAIIEEIVAGIPARPQPVETVPDRREAITLAIREAVANDIILIAGKGHENYQIFRDRTIHFDDREEALAALQQYWGESTRARITTI